MAFKEIAQPETFEARVKLATKMKNEYEMPMTVLVDTMEDQSRALFSDLPSPVFIIDAEGIIQNKFPWPYSQQIKTAVSKMLQEDKSSHNDPLDGEADVSTDHPKVLKDNQGARRNH